MLPPRGFGGTPLRGITPVRNLRPRRFDVHQAAPWGWHVNQPAVGTLTEDMLLSGLACSPLPSRPGFLSSRRAMQGAELRTLGRSACWAGCQLEAVGLTRPENSVRVLDTLLSALSALSQNPHQACLTCAIFPTPRL